MTRVMTLRVLFWNVKGRDSRASTTALERLASLVRQFDPQLVTLIEAPPSAEDRLRHAGVTVLPARGREVGDDNPRGLRTFSLDRSILLRARSNGDRYHRAYEVTMRGHEPLSLITVHLASALHDKGDHDHARRRAHRCRTFVERIEGDAGHTRTIVYGDFNMNPFAHAMVNFDGLNAMSTAYRARRARTLGGESRTAFYNPMWSLLGDRRATSDGRPSPAGTFYMDENGPAGYFWHMPDQVLIRAELSAHLDEVHIVDQIETASLVSRDARRPEPSDHLPVFFAFNRTVWTEVTP